MLQLKSFAKLLLNNPHFRDGEQKVCLVLIGSSRNEGDENRIQSLRLAAKELKIEVDRSRGLQEISLHNLLITIVYHTGKCYL